MPFSPLAWPPWPSAPRDHACLETSRPGWREAARALRFSCAARASLRFAPAPSLRLPPTAGGERERHRPRRLGWAPRHRDPATLLDPVQENPGRGTERPSTAVARSVRRRRGSEAPAGFATPCFPHFSQPAHLLRGANRPPTAICYGHTGAAHPTGGGRWFLGKS